jgi:hypothetical protein
MTHSAEMRVPRKKYSEHKSRAKRRGIAFEMTFQQWWAIWQDRYDDRGVLKHQLGMCRTRDEGGYSPGNVRLDTPKGNGADRSMVVRVKSVASVYRSSAGGRGDVACILGDSYMARDPFAPYFEEDEESA